VISPPIPAAPRRLIAMPACLVAGALSVLAFAPFNYWPVQIAAMSLLFWLSLRQTRIRDSALLACAYGTGWLGAAIWWLYVSMHDYGGLPGWMAALAVVLLAVFLSGFPALALTGEAWFRLRRGVRREVSLLLVLPALWMLSEWLRGWVLTGFPWAATGYAHTDSPLAGYAPLLGVYGLGWLAALLASALLALRQRRLLVLPIAFVLGAGVLLQQVDWTHAHGKPISVRLLQGNVPQEMKFDPSQTRDTLNLYRDMITASPADLVATPETALPILLQRLPADFVQSLVGYTSASGSAVLFGIPAADISQHYANSVIGLGPSAPPASAYRYDKHHLVPFGEFVPPGARWFIDMMHIPLGDFSSGGLAQPPFAVRDQQVMPNICYEDLFGEEIASTIRHAIVDGRPQPTILLNVSNIAWFGDTIALPQHLQISRMRALEVRRPMLRATNTGVTAVISPHGKVLDQLKPYTRGILSATVQGQSGWTPYSLYGNWLVVALALGLLAGVTLRGGRRIAKNGPVTA
jgi:apolipoprotein N-acyltransferase